MSTRKEGFTIVEVLIALVILAVGMLALATTSIFATTQVRVADLKTEQSLAVQEIVEQMRSTSFGSIATRTEQSAVTAGSYAVWWTVTPVNSNLRRVTLFTRGPGYRNRGQGGARNSGWTNAARDTFVVEIANPGI